MHPCSVASLIAVSAPIWMRWDPKPPHELRSFDEKRAGDSEKILFPATGGDLFLFVKSNRADLCFEVHFILPSPNNTHNTQHEHTHTQHTANADIVVIRCLSWSSLRWERTWLHGIKLLALATWVVPMAGKI